MTHNSVFALRPNEALSAPKETLKKYNRFACTVFYLTFILKAATGNAMLSIMCCFPLVQPCRRSERRQKGDPPTRLGHYLSLSGPPSDCLDLFIATMTP